MNEQSHCKSHIFVLPEVIHEKSILRCQNHLPSHPHFLPCVSLSSTCSHSNFLQSLSHTCSALFYFMRSAVTPNLCRTTSPSGAAPWAVKQTNKQTDRAHTLPSLAEFHSYKGSYRARLVSCGWISLAYLAHSAQFQAESYCGPFSVSRPAL